MEDFSLIKQVKEWWWLVSVASTFLFAIAMLYLRDKFTTKEEHARQTAELSAQIEGVKKDVGGVGNRVVKLESLTENLPDRDTFHAMAERIGAVERGVAVTTETVRGVEKMVGKVDHTLTLILENQLKEANR
ncbi:DUF2730 family protein [Microvirga terricola]|uniref:DUF2730 family protein n=1 Tax=Microvirga terricola TaxID=2719797 RepID=A0ABX0V6D9_9HYPH|nr:DUF2730 family protein [Microvirga terricola]NIX75400.1 DUF2730 family protein [Microvirga terricola]